MVSATRFQPNAASLDFAARHLPVHGINHKRIPSDGDLVSLCATSAYSPDGEDCSVSGRCSPSLESNDGPEVVIGGGEFTPQGAWMAASTSASSGIDRRAALRQQGHEVLRALQVSKVPCRRNKGSDNKMRPVQVPSKMIVQQPHRVVATLAWLDPAGSNVRTEPARVDVLSAAFQGIPSQAWHSDGVIFSL